MRAHQLSGSKVDLALHCTYWARPDVEHTVRPVGEAAKRGIAVHRASDQYHKGLVPTFTPEEQDASHLWSTLKGWLHGQEWTYSEYSILYDAEHDKATQCAMGENERDYLDVSPLRIPMRLDLVRIGPDDAYVLDIKTGSKSNTAPAPLNLQLATQAVGVSRLFHVERVHVGLVHPMKTKVHEPEWHLLDGDALDAHAGLLRRTLKTIPTSHPNKGSHCFRCPVGPSRDGQATCPEWLRDEAAE